MNKLLTIKEQLRQGSMQIAYEALQKYMLSLKAHFANEFSGQYSFGNISPGYMGYTCFPFFSDWLRSRKLRFGIVINHAEVRFELC